MDKRTMNENQKELFNKLFKDLRLLKKKEIKLKENLKTKHVYYSENREIWFARTESENKYFYIFGVKKELESGNYELIIDFSKNNPYCGECIGILTDKTVYLHKNNLKNLPNLDMGKYKTKKLVSFDYFTPDIEAIEIGNINSNFIDNLEKLVLDIYEINKTSNQEVREEPIKNNEDISSNENNKIATKNQKLMEEFIKLKHEGKTNKEIYEILDIPRFLIKNWRNQGKLGNKKYREFYEAYLIDNNPKPKNTPQIKKEKHETKKTADIIGENKKIPDEDTCEICGRKLPKNHIKNICKRCQRNKYAIKILETILPIAKPGIPFNKEDLNILDLKKLQIQDYVWTLQELDLITEKNSKIILKDMDTLNKFAEENNATLNIKKDNKHKLNKTCEICNKTLEISNFFKSEENEDGYEDYCKNCKKLILSAIFLKELSEYVNWEDEFKEEDISEHFQDPLLLQGNIWNLLESDLITKNHDINTYKLTSKEKGIEFIEKYYKEIQPKKIIKKEQEPKESPQKTEKIEQMEIVLKAMDRRRTRKEAAILAKIPPYKITHWYNEGKNGFGDDNKRFYESLEKIEKKHKPYSITTLKNQINNFLSQFKKNQNLDESIDSAKINKDELNDWIILGEKNINPYDSFLKEYAEITNKKTNEKVILENDENTDDNYHSDINNAKRKIFLEYIKIGSSLEKACKQSSLDINIVNNWINKGKENIEPYAEFYEKYDELRQNKPENNIQEISEYRKMENRSKRDVILKQIENGKTLKEACEYVSIDIELVNDWINKGKQNIFPYDKFYKEYSKLSDKTYKINEDEKEKNETKRESLLKDDKNSEYEELIEISSDEIEFSLDKKENEFFIYIKEGLNIEEACEKSENDLEYVKNKLTDKEDDFYNLYVEAKILNKLGNYPKINESFSYAFSNNINKMNKILKLTIKGCEIRKACIVAGTSYDTYKHWINRGEKEFGEIYADFYHHIKKINELKIEIDEELKNELIKNETKNKSKDEYEDILDLIFDYSSEEETDTGFIYVRNTKKGWVYENPNVKKDFKLTDENLYSLYKRVKNLNYKWGVTDRFKAYRTLVNEKKPDENNVKKTIPKNKDNDELIKNILAPLPQEYEEYFKSTKTNKTGFAWTNKVGNNWIYSRNSDGKHIKITNSNIFKLYEEVIKNNHIWGVRNLNKAIKTIENEKQIKITDIEKNKNNDITQKIPDKKYEPTNHLNEDILSELPENYEKSFISAPPSKTGFAWVNKNGNNWEYKRSINGKNFKIIDANIYELHKKVLEKKLVWGVRDLDKAKKTLESENNKEISDEPTKIENNITATYLSRNKFYVNILIKGLIKENELFYVLSKLKPFETYIARIITNKINNEIDLLIELNLDIDLLSNFEEEMKKIGWDIKKLF